MGIKYKAVTRIERPKSEFGVNFQTKRYVIARFGQKELQWHRACSAYTNRAGGIQSFKAKLILVDYKKEPNGLFGDELQEGGRLSNKLFRQFRQEIDDFFGFKVADELHFSWTIIIEEKI
jgi:hypothetical protein